MTEKELVLKLNYARSQATYMLDCLADGATYDRDDLIEFISGMEKTLSAIEGEAWKQIPEGSQEELWRQISRDPVVL